MDTDEPFIETETRRRRRRSLFRHRRVPVRMLVPNFFTLLGLCAGLTSIRMGIEGRYDLAVAAIVFAACLDGIDGRIARLLKASSRFGAELDSLADFVNFGVAPAFLIFNWGLGDLKSAGWICVMIFALASALRLARFNAALDDEKPKWQSNYFMGMPTPAAAIAVLLPLYLDQLGLGEAKAQWALKIVLVYTVFVAFMMVSTIPTYSGKLLGERVGREWVLPIFVVAVGLVAFLFTYPYETLTVLTAVYLGFIPVSWRAFRDKSEDDAALATASAMAAPSAAPAAPQASGGAPSAVDPQASGRIVTFRPTDQPK
ncbi:CDP-diacylglycerol--serine O-phosphatidyltransferase [Hyphomicrobium sp.]|uniref:CDP-diacylglycerol--serine O-phosphatidyltransferase n=1 Tax=Hyphomicrobium sp. TaxID=82 RepID=UPI000F929DC2|nr:CDP-diacylglycerol--serine O-phosphatidyltransferase [Hyphomicrobium sp.]RUO99934.1 MAG: CDP-diacylglycerol--serine O-phosphatidyltransferase [Hyphomicrobium sp.]